MIATPDLTEATLEWLNDLSPHGILITDAALIIRGWNRWMELHSGRRAVDVLGRSLLEAYPELVERRMDDAYRQALSGQTVVLAHRLHMYLLPMPPSTHELNFSQMQQSARITPLLRGGQVIGTLTTIDDVTERVVKENDLRFLADVSMLLTNSLNVHATLESVARLVVPTLADSCTIYLCEQDGSHRQVVRLHRDPQKEAILDELCQRYPAELKESYGVEYVLRTQQPLLFSEIPEILLKPEHDEIARLIEQLAPRSYLIVPLFTREKTLGAIMFGLNDSNRRYGPADLLLAQDLARRTALMIDNARLYDQAQRSVHMRDQFLSIASHELKNPISSLLGYAEITYYRAEQSGSDERILRQLNVLLIQARRLRRLIDSLLDISRLQDGMLAIEHKTVEVGLVVQQLVEEIDHTTSSHTLRYRPPQEELSVEGDELRLEQVLYNLLRNAIKYSPGGGPIDIWVARQGSYVEISVTDYGIGIPQAEIPDLFQPFYRATNVDQQTMSGMGLGLAVVKEIVTLHQGVIHIQSTEGQGTTVRISLPLKQLA